MSTLFIVKSDAVDGREDEYNTWYRDKNKNLKFKVFASGDSYNDIQMLQEADFGVFFQAPSHIREEFLEIPGVESHEELKEVLIKQSSFVQIK